MKTAVSISDEIYERAERFARRTKRSRSRLISDALGEYLARHETDEVTESMNAVMADLSASSDPFVRAASTRVLEGSDW